MTSDAFVTDTLETINKLLAPLIIGDTIADSIFKYADSIYDGRTPLEFGPAVQNPSQLMMISDICDEAMYSPIPIEAEHKSLLESFSTYAGGAPDSEEFEISIELEETSIPISLDGLQIEDLDLHIPANAKAGIPPPIPDEVKHMGAARRKLRWREASSIEVGARLESASRVYLMERRLPGRNPVFVASEDESGIEFVVKGYVDEIDPHGFTRDSITLNVFSGKEQNILSACESIEGETGSYNVFRFIDGMNLHQFLNSQGPLRDQDLLTIFPQILDALALIHESGVIHRDIKEGNIMIDRKMKPYVFDFDMCYHASIDSLEQHGLLRGTMTHMAPEIWGGQAKDPRSDLYAMGVVLYRALTNHSPFYCRSKDVSFGKRGLIVAMQHLKKEIPDPRQFNPSISNEMVYIIRKALAKDPADRYQSAQDMKNDILLAAL